MPCEKRLDTAWVCRLHIVALTLLRLFCLVSGQASLRDGGWISARHCGEERRVEAIQSSRQHSRRTTCIPARVSFTELPPRGRTECVFGAQVCSCLGADMYDCVYPTRTARFGTALVPEVR